MAFTSWRGVVGCIKPTLRPGGLEELIRMLPEGIGVLPLFLNISHGTTDEFKRATAPSIRKARRPSCCSASRARLSS